MSITLFEKKKQGQPGMALDETPAQKVSYSQKENQPRKKENLI